MNNLSEIKLRTDGKCPLCKSKGKLNKKYESCYCKKCNMWISKKCGDEYCSFCNGRPEKPFEE